MATYWSDMCWRRTLVYRFYSADGELLYVGLTANLEGRLGKHRRRSWWPDVARITTEEFPDRTTAQIAERSAIHHENPLHNLVRPRLECC